MSGDGFSRRFEIVAETRRRWSHEEKLAIVSEASGAYVNISAVARRHGIKPALLYRWRKELGNVTEPSASLVPVVVTDPTLDETSAAQAEPKVEPKAGSGSTRSAVCDIEITLTNGRLVKVAAGLDAAILKRLLATIEA